MANVTITLTATELKTLNSIMAKAEAAKTAPATTAVPKAVTKKTAVKKAATVKPATKKSNRKIAKISSQKRIVIPYKMIDRTGLRGAKVRILRKKGVNNAFYMVDASVRYNKRNYNSLRTIELPYSKAQIHIGKLLDVTNLKQVNVDVVKNMIEVTI